MESIEERLIALRAQLSGARPNIATPLQNHTKLQDPPDHVKQSQSESKHPHPFDKITNFILQREFIMPNIPPEFAHFRIPCRPVKTSMTDEELRGGHGITIERRDPNAVCYLGRYIIPMLAYGFTAKGASVLISLVYNLLKPGGKFTEYVFNGAEELESVGDKVVDDFPDQPILSCHVYHEIPASDCAAVVEAAYYAFIATSTLRLFSKSPMNYVSAWDHILNGFEKLYKVRVDISVPVPTVAAVTGLANWYTSNPVAKQTLYRFLYMGGVKDDAYGLKEFLYGIHLNFTGMHAAPMFMQLCSILNCEPAFILRLIDAYQTRKQVDCLIAFLKMHMNNEEEYKRGVWKCGRIFDHSFLADIQTKACPELVYVFGLTLKALMPRRYENVLSIAHLRGMGEENKKRCAIASVELLKSMQKYINDRPAT